MTGEERRAAIIELLKCSDEPLSGTYIAKQLNVSRQIIVQDMALLRAKNQNIQATHKGYIIDKSGLCQRVFKMKHEEEDIRTELDTIVDLGGAVIDVFVYHKVFNVIRAELNIRSRRDVNKYMDQLESGVSTTLWKVTDGYHYHTVVADSEEILDEIQTALGNLGFLAKLQEYEPVDFWGQDK